MELNANMYISVEKALASRSKCTQTKTAHKKRENKKGFF